MAHPASPTWHPQPRIGLLSQEPPEPLAPLLHYPARSSLSASPGRQGQGWGVAPLLVLVGSSHKIPMKPLLDDTGSLHKFFHG